MTTNVKTTAAKAEEPKAPLPKDIELLSDEVTRRIDPFAQVGTMDTSGTGGVLDNSVDAVSPIFRQARLENLRVAARALDPEDSTPSELVVLPEGAVTVHSTAKTAEEGRADVARALEKATTT